MHEDREGCREEIEQKTIVTNHSSLDNDQDGSFRAFDKTETVIESLGQIPLTADEKLVEF